MKTLKIFLEEKATCSINGIREMGNFLEMCRMGFFGGEGVRVRGGIGCQ